MLPVEPVLPELVLLVPVEPVLELLVEFVWRGSFVVDIDLVLPLSVITIL